jgi:hypothetical protein
LGAALHACLLSGCLGNVIDRSPPLQTAAGPVEENRGPRSDYHVRLPEPSGDKALAEPVQPVHAEEKSSEPPAPPEAPPVPAVPKPLPTVLIGTSAETRPAPPAEEPLVEALRLLLDKRKKDPAEALALLQRYDKPTQELLLGLLSLSARLGEGGIDRAAPEEVALIREQLNGLSTALRGRAPLTLDKLCFCRKISNFGGYDPLPSDYAFQAGAGKLPGERVRVYAEVRNFTSQARGPYYETCLSSTLEIRDAAGGLVRSWELPPQLDRSHTLRQDYFITFTFRIQPDMAPGWYVLWVQVQEDVGGGATAPRIARRSLDFRVTANGFIQDVRERRVENAPTREGEK